jgi:phenylpyruvate tautomerase PptA (4-oxalocrotonate tautomerase family)
MPVYEVITTEGTLTDEQRQEIATAVVQAHCSNTGAPELFVNVVFRDLPSGRVYSAGKPSHMSLIAGTIRAGRTIEVKQQIIRDLSDSWARITGLPVTDVILAIDEIDALASMELGLIYPLPGTEAAWFEEHKAHLAELGITSLA